ncbi:hypothetical protein [Nocardia sp. alder85J]|uniref:hypothetical protein n=1 Tax=Nocardia sp. alder85J TaxID=2862949 RepID=UPI001CD80BE8|nr:hypothetical protein [Nocardia sp. alder85J]MCX4095188.1 hypothetical protein [Nocardia sp. alder85J]
MFHQHLGAAIVAAAALTVTAATATAAPSPHGDDPAAVHYTVTRDGDAAVVATTDGALTIVGDQLVLTDRADEPVAAVPLGYRVDDVAHPITARLRDRGTAILTLSTDDPRPVRPVTADEIVTVDRAAAQVAESFTPRDGQALGVFAQRAAIGVAVSAVLGAVLGGGVGCLVGAAAGAAMSSPVIALLVPFVGATVAGCVLGVATLGAVGSMAGTVLAGGPIMLFSAIQYFSTVLTPCPLPAPTCVDPAAPPVPALR